MGTKGFMKMIFSPNRGEILINFLYTLKGPLVEQREILQSGVNNLIQLIQQRRTGGSQQGQ